MRKRKKLTWLSAALVFAGLLTLLGAYVGIYCATVVPTDIEMEVSSTSGPAVAFPFVYEVYQIPIDPGLAQWIFSPIHKLDRRMRPQVWKD